MKYIDAEKLKAEIQKRSMHAYEAITADEPKYRTHYKLGKYEGLSNLIDFIDSLQQEQLEVDLEKEIKNYLATECAEDDEPSVSEIAHHFYELGLKSK